MPSLEKSDSSDLLIELTAEIVAAYVSNNSVAANDLPGVIAHIHAALGGTVTPAEEVLEKPKPAVSVRRSIQNDHLICLEDGQKYKSLKRHLMTHHGLPPEQYRAEMGPAGGLPNGRTILCRSPFATGERHGPWTKAQTGQVELARGASAHRQLTNVYMNGV